MEIRQKRIRQIAIVLLIVFAAFFVFNTTVEISYAVGNETYLSDEITPFAKSGPKELNDIKSPELTEGEDDSFKENVTTMKNILGLDIENVGVLAKARHAVAVGLATVASIMFALQINLTYIVVIFVNWSETMPWLDSMASAMGNFINNNLGVKFFSFNKNSPIYLMIFFAMAGIALSIARMRVTEGFGKAAKLIILIALAICLTSQSVNVYNTINQWSNDLKQAIKP